MNRVLTWWQGLPSWAKWTVGLVALLLAGVVLGWTLFRGKASAEQVEAKVKAEEAVDDAEEAVVAAEVMAGDVEADLADAPAKAAVEDEAALAAAKAAAASVAGDGTQDLGGGARGGTLPGGDFDDELGI